jgi:hypothetical protein
MINSIHPMSLDLYGLSMSPPPPPPSSSSSSIVPTGSSSSPPPPPSSTDHSTNPNSSDLVPLSTSIDSISKQQTPPVIYPWMRKVHINNPGKIKSFISLKFFSQTFFFSMRKEKRGK